MKPQTERTLRVLRAKGGDGLTPLEALELVGTQRLAARIYELQAEGYDITRTLKATARGARIACYVLHESEQLVLL
jgi:hypothetical protein